MPNPLKKAIIHFLKLIFNGKIEEKWQNPKARVRESELFEKVL